MGAWGGPLRSRGRGRGIIVLALTDCFLFLLSIARTQWSEVLGGESYLCAYGESRALTRGTRWCRPSLRNMVSI